MKKLFLTSLVVVLSLVSVSCSSDDDGGSLPATLTGGTWKLVSLSINGDDVTATELDVCDLEETYVFNEDNTFVFNSNKSEDSNGNCSGGNTVNGIWQDNTTGFIGAFEGDDITNEEDQLVFVIEDQKLREDVVETDEEGTRTRFIYRYEKQ